MEQERYYFRVGILVSISLALLIGVMGWLAVNKKRDTTIAYAIYFDGSVEGLTLGAPVTFKGIPVGQVKAINFDSYDNDRILVIADILDTAPIRKNTIASLSIRGITGTAYISLESVGTDMTALTRAEDAHYIIIPSKQSSLEKVFTTVPELLDQLNKMAEQGQKLMSDENVAAFASLLSSVDQSAASVSRVLAGNNAKSLESALSELNQLLLEGKVTMREIRMLARTLREDPSVVIHGVKNEGKKLP